MLPCYVKGLAGAGGGRVSSLNVLYYLGRVKGQSVHEDATLLRYQGWGRVIVSWRLYVRGLRVSRVQQDVTLLSHGVDWGGRGCER